MQKNANPGDTATTKGILDDAVVQSFEDAGFAEDHRLSNLKLFLGALACTFALIAQVCLTNESLKILGYMSESTAFPLLSKECVAPCLGGAPDNNPYTLDSRPGLYFSCLRNQYMGCSLNLP